MAFNVLIADDSSTTRKIIIKALRHSEVDIGQISEAADGIEALAVLEESWIDIVFADLNMPRMGGVELVERMAETEVLAKVPVVIVSTEGRQQRVDALLASGVAAYVRKPFSPETLAQTVNGLLVAPTFDAVVDQLREALFGALEGFTMLIAEPVAAAPAAPERASIARMHLIGANAVADVAVTVPEPACRVIAEMATGESTSTAGCDALMELLNVTCGHLVDALPGGPFQMDAPHGETVAGANAWAEATSYPVHLAFDVEGVPLIAGLRISERW